MLTTYDQSDFVLAVYHPLIGHIVPGLEHNWSNNASTGLNPARFWHIMTFVAGIYI